MSESRLSERELLILIEGACRAALSQIEIDRLGRAMDADPTARQLYRTYLSLDAELHWHHTRAIDASPLKSEIFTKISKNGLLTILADLEGGFDQEIALRPLESINPAHTNPGGKLSWHFGFSRRLVGWAASIAIVGYFAAIACFLVWHGFRALDEQQQVVKHRLNVSGALLTYADDAHWKTDAAGNALENRVLEVQSGLAKLTFSQGAEVVIGGPAEFEVRSPNGGFLRWGKFAAHVPPRAVGFEVETPTARIVDLGTDFRLAVNPQGTKLAVATGKTDLYALSVAADGNKHVSSSPRRLASREAAMVTTTVSGTTTIQETKYDPNWLAEIAPESSSSSVMAYQSSNGAAGNQSDFHGGVGLDFEVREPIRVHSLGVFDHLGDGIDSTTLPVAQLWSRDNRGTPDDPKDDVGSELLATQEFTANNGGRLRSGHRFKLLPVPIDLPIGSYSIVVYHLSGANPFIGSELLDFSKDPGWKGVNNASQGNNFGWSSPANPLGGLTGKIGGVFARAKIDSFYGDTQLSKRFTLDDKFGASGNLRFCNISEGWGEILGGSGLFIGYFSTDPASDEFLGIQLKEANDTNHMAALARFHLPGMEGSESPQWIIMNADENHTFDFKYDPKLGERGRLTLCLDQSEQLVADLNLTERHSKARFDAFGMGAISTLNSENESSKTAEVYIDDVTYSGCRDGKVADGELRIDSLKNPVVAVGSRWGDAEPGVFPARRGDEPAKSVAGSFEYSLLQIPQAKSEK